MVINVSFSGSGQLYPIFIGTLLCLQDRGIRVAEVSATSGGAIIAAGMASGYKPGPGLIELIKRTLPLRNKLFDLSLITLFTKWGLIGGNKIEAVFHDKLAKTLGESKIPIYITTANISKRRVRVLSSHRDPDFSLPQAVRMSISIPLLFAPVVHDDDHYVDGGWVKNFPMDVFTNGLPTLGFRFHTKNTLGSKIKKLKDYLVGLIETLIRANEDEDIADSTNSHVVDIPTKYSSLNFNVSESDVDTMIQEGYRATDAWLDKNAKKVFNL